ncbi:hypothetical protein MMC30_006426 [Trapelia coarctata]|nr:hypothetical protein [Trapelia coarctata]
MQYLLATSLLASLLSVASARVVNTERDSRPRAAYTLDNDAAGASIIAMKISLGDGTLSSPVKISTGGQGLLGNNANGPGGPDGLFGQNAIIVSEDYLFTVNPGSNSVSMFSIDNDDPTRLIPVGEPATTLGDFPMAVAYSSALKTVCALNGGKTSGVTCFSTDHKKGLTVLDEAPRSMSPALQQTTPPVGPPSTASNIFFNPDSTALIAVVKGNPGTTPPTASTFFVWPVVHGKVSTEAVISSPSDLLVNFGGNFVTNDMLMTTDASFGVALLKVTSDFNIVEEVHTAVTDQRALCWGAYAPRFNTFYGFDAGRTTIYEFNPTTAAIKGMFTFDATLQGAFDAAIDRTSLYFLTGVGNVAVVSLKGSNSGKVPRMIQTLDISFGGSTKNFQGEGGSSQESDHLVCLRGQETSLCLKAGMLDRITSLWTHPLQRPKTSLTITFLAWKLLLFFVAVSSPGPGYDTSTFLVQPSPSYVPGKFVRWDAIYFTQIARRGYVFEQEWAFGWGFTRILAVLGKGLTYFAIADPGNAEAVAGIALAHVSHLLSVLVLFALSNEILDSIPKAAFISAALHVFSPAGLFLSAPYAESPFALLQIAGYYFYVKSRKRGTTGGGCLCGYMEIVVSGLLFGLATTLRSNGLLNGILLAWDAVEYGIELLKGRFMMEALQKLTAVVVAGLFVLLGTAVPQYIAYQEYCSGPVARSWCNGSVPSIYAWVQSHYW